MSRFKHQLKDYFSFTRKEIISISALTFLIIIILILPYFYHQIKGTEKVNISSINAQFDNFESKVKRYDDSLKQRKQQKQKSKNGFNNTRLKYNNSSPPQYVFKKPELVELNAADSFELMKLRGIGPVFARRIINYRKLLGGYCRKEQLLEVWGMDTVRYNMIKNYIVVNTDSIHKININKASFKKLIRHPYMKYDIAVALSKYKAVHGDFKNADEIKRCRVVNDSVFRILIPYIGVK